MLVPRRSLTILSPGTAAPLLLSTVMDFVLDAKKPGASIRKGTITGSYYPKDWDASITQRDTAGGAITQRECWELITQVIYWELLPKTRLDVLWENRR
ncbi:hypothetical protein Tco_1139196 [Tanacetum coccineum]